MRAIWIAVGAALLPGQWAYAQAEPARSPPQVCRDGNGVVPCANDNRSSAPASFAMAGSHAEALDGVEAFRVFYVDGFGEAWPPIAFERRPGEPPKAVVYGKMRRIEAPATVEAWEKVRVLSEFADRTLVPIVPGEAALENICLDGGTVTVEIINGPVRLPRPGAIRSRTESTCGSGLTSTFAFDLFALALDQFPACKALIFGSAEDRLALCTTLLGDTIAAANLVNEIGARGPQRGDFESAQGWAFWIGVNAAAELDWAGEVIKDADWNGDRVATFLAARSTEASIYLQPQTIEGLSSKSVRVRGQIYSLSHKDQTRLSAAYEQAWVWDAAAKEWMLKSWKVEGFTPAPYRR